MNTDIRTCMHAQEVYDVLFQAIALPYTERVQRGAVFNL